MKILDFPNLVQAYEYDCGASVLQAVLLYFGIDIRKEVLMKEADTKETGTSIINIEKVLKGYNLDIDSREMNIEDIKKYIDQGFPVIVLLQAWREDEKTPWADDWSHGHYVVAIGYDENKIYFEDPYISGRSWLEFSELSDRWHDIVDNQKYSNHGIAVFGKDPAYNSDSTVHMD